MFRPRPLLLVAAFAGILALSHLATAPAQPKAVGVAQPKAVGAAQPLGTLEIYEAKDGYRFRVKGLDGKVLAQPAKGQKTKEDCLKSLDTIKAILNSGKVIEIKK